MKVYDLSAAIGAVYEDGQFDLEKWKAGTDALMPGITPLCLEDLKECLDAGLSFETDYLPVLNAVLKEEKRRALAAEAYHQTADCLEDAIVSVFGRTVEADLVLYLGLCSGAGWAVSLNGRPTVLLGIEKILELHWEGRESMKALILHELGHLYQEQYGVLRRECSEGSDRFLWQLFTEGIAMVFEQEVLGDPAFYHQGAEWISWCVDHLSQIAQGFSDALDTMTFENQRFFGDWVCFEGQPDTGYYLGARFVRDLLSEYRFDDLIRWEIGQVRDAFARFLSRLG